jgi:type VI secretion system protein ImpH
VAPKSRDKNPALKKPPSASQEMGEALREQPLAFDFFQAVRLMNRLLPDREVVGLFSDPSTEVIRFGAEADFSFPASQIAELKWPEGTQPRMNVNFMGLTGPNGVLPLYYSALICERMRANDTAMLEFFNIFNHRIISLFYRAWEKHHYTVAYERGETDTLSPHLMDLIGLGTSGLGSRLDIRDEALLFRSGLLSTHTRSAVGLRSLLIDYFDVPVEIEQFIGSWYPIDEETQCCFSGTSSDSERLGFGTVVGDEVWDQQSGVRVRLGPLTLKQYLDFLPDGSAHRPLLSLVRFFAGNELSIDVQLILKKEETPSCELGGEGPTAPRLGWLTWAKTKPRLSDPDESILEIRQRDSDPGTD